MILLRRPRTRIFPYICRFTSADCVTNNTAVTNLCKYLKINQSQAKHLCIKYPTVNKLNGRELQDLVETVIDLGYNKKVLLEEPQLFSVLPITLKNRYKVLEECGLQVSPTHIVLYLNIMKQRTIQDLKKQELLPLALNIENRLASYMTKWPTSLTTLIYGDANTNTLHQLRLKIIQRYLELVLDLTEEEFVRGIATYPTIKHRPLAVINETLKVLQRSIMMPDNKIKNNLYLIHADPENLKEVIYKFKSIGGIDIKEIMRLRPKIVMKRYQSLVEMRQVLEEFGISDEAQVRCFEIYTLSPDTVRERLTKARRIPEFQVLFNHPRFLKMIYYNNTAMNRLRTLHLNNKKCLSLNILSGSSNCYKLCMKAPGDRTGKGKDMVFCLSQAFGNKYRSSDIRDMLRRHPFWINVPVPQVQFTYEKLSTGFPPKDIFENCAILLYPWNKIKEVLNQMSSKNKIPWLVEQIDLINISKSQTLSIVLYLLEKNHYFSGNGVWTEEQIKYVDLNLTEDSKLL